MIMRRLSLTLFLVLLALNVGHAIYYYPQLPEKVASHFGPSGRPDGWSTRTDFITFYLGVAGILAVVFLGISFGLSKIPVSLVNLPNKDYWFAEERKQKTIDFMFSYLLGYASATLLLLLDTFNQCFQVNLGKAETLPHFMLSMGLYIGFTTLWLARLILKFRKKGKCN
jgi:uncharacterized membrane protein